MLSEVIQDGGIGLLSGEPGSGKTTLLQWAKTFAEGQGFTVASLPTGGPRGVDLGQRVERVPCRNTAGNQWTCVPRT